MIVLLTIATSYSLDVDSDADSVDLWLFTHRFASPSEAIRPPIGLIVDHSSIMFIYILHSEARRYHSLVLGKELTTEMNIRAICCFLSRIYEVLIPRLHVLCLRARHP